MRCCSYCHRPTVVRLDFNSVGAFSGYILTLVLLAFPVCCVLLTTLMVLLPALLMLLTTLRMLLTSLLVLVEYFAGAV
jgi:hypothetical protein